MIAPAIRVPYVTAWSEEAVEHPLAFEYHPEAGGFRLTYTVDPHPGDWVYGVLRARHGLAPGRGRPHWKVVNTLRQWRCMDQRLCQVCGGQATDEVGRVWWVLTDEPPPDEAPLTNAPPTCCSCIPEAIALCPRLQRSAVVYSVGDCEPCAVLGDRFTRTNGNGVALVERNAIVQLDEYRALTEVLGKQLLVRLHDVRRERWPGQA